MNQSSKRWSDDLVIYEKDGIQQIEYAELKDIIENKQKDSIIIDVREVEEYVEGHIPNVPLVLMNKIPEVISQFDKEKEYIFVCRSGVRSQNVALFFKNHGFEKVSNYAGGMLAWEGPKEEGPEWIVKDVSESYK